MRSGECRWTLGIPGDPTKCVWFQNTFQKEKKDPQFPRREDSFAFQMQIFTFKVHLVGPPRLARVELGLDLQITPLPSS